MPAPVNVSDIYLHTMAVMVSTCLFVVVQFCAAQSTGGLVGSFLFTSGKSLCVAAIIHLLCCCCCSVCYRDITKTAVTGSKEILQKMVELVSAEW